MTCLAYPFFKHIFACLSGLSGLPANVPHCVNPCAISTCCPHLRCVGIRYAVVRAIRAPSAFCTIGRRLHRTVSFLRLVLARTSSADCPGIDAIICNNLLVAYNENSGLATWLTPLLRIPLFMLYYKTKLTSCKGVFIEIFTI